MLRKGDVKMRKRFLMKVVSFSFLAMCSGFITHTVKAEERPSVEVSTLSTETTVTENKQDNVISNNPINQSVALKDVHEHYQKCKQADEEKTRQIRLEKLRKKRLRIKRQRLKRKQELEKSSLGTFLITAYCPCYECSEGYGSKIAWNHAGHRFARPYHTIAVDKNIIPYGTRVKIEGYGDTIFVAEDCGGKVKGMHVDVFKSTHSETINVQQHRKIYVVK